MSTETPTRLTAEDLLTLPDSQRFELVDGELRELSMSEDSSWIAGEILYLLRLALARTESGWLFPEGTAFRCFPDDPNRVRKPDCSFLRRKKRPRGPESVGFTEVVPDLVVEVISPNDLQWQVSEKISEWLEAGAGVVWEVMPRSRTVTVHRRGGKPQILSADDEITLGLIPEFRCTVADFFPPMVEGTLDSTS